MALTFSWVLSSRYKLQVCRTTFHVVTKVFQFFNWIFQSFTDNLDPPAFISGVSSNGDTCNCRNENILVNCFRLAGSRFIISSCLDNRWFFLILFFSVACRFLTDSVTDQIVFILYFFLDVFFFFLSNLLLSSRFEIDHFPVCHILQPKWRWFCPKWFLHGMFSLLGVTLQRYQKIRLWGLQVCYQYFNVLLFSIAIFLCL